MGTLIPQKRWLGNEKILWTKCILGELSPQLQWTTGRTWTETSAGSSKVHRAQGEKVTAEMESTGSEQEGFKVGACPAAHV